MRYECQLKQIKPQPILSIRGTTSIADLPKNIGAFLMEVWTYIEKNGGKPVGPPFTRYHSTDNLEALDLEAGLPVADPMPGSARVKAGTLPGGEVIATDHIGSYEGLPNAGEALARWCKQEGRTAAGPNWEVYWTDPGAEKDPSKLRTEVVKPLAPKA
jgi:effector-binding domain-containing protein